MKYEIVKNLPVAKFFYKGSHSHAVRRTVLVIESTGEYIKGYELREGTITRIAEKAPIKTYCRCKIARGANLRAENPIRKKAPEKSTLIRKPLMDIIKTGF